MTLRDGVERHIIQPIHALHALDAVQQALARNEGRAAQRGIIRTPITTPKPIVTPMNDEQPLGGIAQAPRTPWADFPDAVIHQSIPTVQGHPSHRSPEEAQRIPGASKNGQYHHHLSACANIFACVNALRNVTIAPRNTLRSFRATFLNGGKVILATSLTGPPYSAKLTLSDDTLSALKAKHGKAFEDWFQQTFGYGLDWLTESEARYLTRAESLDTIRDRLAQARSQTDR